MKKFGLVFLFVLAILSVILASCSAQAQPASVAIIPTETMEPTATTTPEFTPTPVYTATPTLEMYVPAAESEYGEVDWQDVAMVTCNKNVPPVPAGFSNIVFIGNRYSQEYIYAVCATSSDRDGEWWWNATDAIDAMIFINNWWDLESLDDAEKLPVQWYFRKEWHTGSFSDFLFIYKEHPRWDKEGLILFLPPMPDELTPTPSK